MNEQSGNPLRFETNPYHNLVMKDRKYLELSGIQLLESFDSEEFLMETTQGWLMITGKDLVLSKLDTERGDVIISGMIDTLQYLNDKKSSDKESFFRKLMK